MKQNTLLDVARQIRGPTIIEPLGRPVELPNLDALVARVRELVGGRPRTFAVATAYHPDLAPFPAITVKVGDFVLASIADRWSGEAEARAALRIFEAAL